ncbi:hypothetical protein A3765_28465 [Oleiphilus sp. HI0130]|nr:hypothetical protein A3765_28820 [Oleiphilus sp. HI0130]KZZ72486.1 hypothetical protein A3765_28465 [Oleiphilus sp. HI0130]
MDVETLKANLANRWWRLNNLYYILDKYGKKVLFRPNAAQTGYLQNRHFLNCILKARQMGFSTAIQVDMLDRTLFNTNWNAGVIAQDRNTAEDIFDNKIKFAFDNLPEALRRKYATTQDSARRLQFANGSSVTVGTSLRGGTLQQLHVSELGKIAAQYPKKAREIKTGAFNTVAAGNLIDVESTAEGQEGEFYDRVQIARKHTDHANSEGRSLHEMEWKFHFFAWWSDPSYTVSPNGITIPPRLNRYFTELYKEHGIALTPGQRAWYAMKEEDQGDEDMFREYPSHPDEAFHVAIKGAYYAAKIRELRQKGLITKIPISDGFPVHTAWDLGMSDATAIWFFQIIGREIRVIDYHEESDKGFPYYAQVLKEKGYYYGQHFGPHDLNVRELFGPEGDAPPTRADIAKSHGINFTVISRVPDMREGRESVRQTLPMCAFDAERCADGIKALEHYRREWDQLKGVYSNQPRHDWSSHAAKAFETMARAPLFTFSSGMKRERTVTRGKMGAWT